MRRPPKSQHHATRRLAPSGSIYQEMIGVRRSNAISVTCVEVVPPVMV
ncbi:hypothetical protein [Sphingobium sp. 15-1]|nr:hypothetical protein [Sphingobium sp. 15-1]